MTKPKQLANITEYGPALTLFLELTGGDTTLLEIDDGNYTAGELALLGAVLSYAGQRATDLSKKSAAPQLEGRERELADFGVRFTWREPGTQQRLDTRAVRREFPPEVRPDFYVESTTKGGVIVHLPKYAPPEEPDEA